MLKTFPGPGYLRSEDGVVWLWHPLVNFYIWFTISSCYGSITLALVLIGRVGGLSTLCNSCRFAEGAKNVSGPGYLRSEDKIVWLWHPLLNLYMWITISLCYCSIPLALRFIGNDGSLSTLCHSCEFSCQQGLLKTFPSPAYLRSKDGVVWLWYSLVNLYIYIYIYIYLCVCVCVFVCLCVCVCVCVCWGIVSV